MLQIKELYCVHEEKPILSDISLQIEKGDFVALVGPNGSGKTSLLRCVLELLPYTGDIFFNDKNLRLYPRREIGTLIGYVPQTTQTLPNFSVEEFVMMGRYAHHYLRLGDQREWKRAIARSLEVTRTEQFRSRTVSSLSGGELQRVLLAAALAQEPQLLVLDEPAAFLDPSHEVLLYQILRDIHQEAQQGICMVTHDINSAVTACNRVVALRDGSLIFDGEPKEFLTEDVLQQTFLAPFSIIRNPVTQRTFAFPELTRSAS